MASFRLKKILFLYLEKCLLCLGRSSTLAPPGSGTSLTSHLTFLRAVYIGLDALCVNLSLSAPRPVGQFRCVRQQSPEGKDSGLVPIFSHVLKSVSNMCKVDAAAFKPWRTRPLPGSCPDTLTCGFHSHGSTKEGENDKNIGRSRVFIRKKKKQTSPWNPQQNSTWSNKTRSLLTAKETRKQRGCLAQFHYEQNRGSMVKETGKNGDEVTAGCIPTHSAGSACSSELRLCKHLRTLPRCPSGDA